eukprot:6179013-Pleurochrysis_carterae.AAC.3
MLQAVHGLSCSRGLHVGSFLTQKFACHNEENANGLNAGAADADADADGAQSEYGQGNGAGGRAGGGAGARGGGRRGGGDIESSGIGSDEVLGNSAREVRLAVDATVSAPPQRRGRNDDDADLIGFRPAACATIGPVLVRARISKRLFKHVQLEVNMFEVHAELEDGGL